MDAEITTRPEAGERILQPGQYVVGKDIAQGVYDVGFVAAEEDDTYTNWYIYDTKQMYDYDVSRLFLGDLPRNEGRVQEGSSNGISLSQCRWNRPRCIPETQGTRPERRIK